MRKPKEKTVILVTPKGQQQAFSISHAERLLDAVRKLLLATKVTIVAIARETAVKAILMPARKQNMVQPHIKGLLRQAWNVAIAVHDLSALILEIVVRVKSR